VHALGVVNAALCIRNEQDEEVSLNCRKEEPIEKWRTVKKAVKRNLARALIPGTPLAPSAYQGT
jgi:hypothetical protein